jgi:hypothetical protein
LKVKVPRRKRKDTHERDAQSLPDWFNNLSLHVARHSYPSLESEQPYPIWISTARATTTATLYTAQDNAALECSSKRLAAKTATGAKSSERHLINMASHAASVA